MACSLLARLAIFRFHYLFLGLSLPSMARFLRSSPVCCPPFYLRVRFILLFVLVYLCLYAIF